MDEYGAIKEQAFAGSFSLAGEPIIRHSCASCGRNDLELSTDVRERQMSIDHVIPLAFGGGNDSDNLQLLCLPCNSQKGNMHNDEFILYREHKEFLERVFHELVEECQVDRSVVDRVVTKVNYTDLYLMLKPLIK